MDETKANEIKAKIGDLVKELLQLVAPTDSEIKEAIDALTEDPLNDIHSIVHMDDFVGQILIADEILADRAREIEDANS